MELVRVLKVSGWVTPWLLKILYNIGKSIVYIKSHKDCQLLSFVTFYKYLYVFFSTQLYIHTIIHYTYIILWYSNFKLYIIKIKQNRIYVPTVVPTVRSDIVYARTRTVHTSYSLHIETVCSFVVVVVPFLFWRKK